MGSLPGSRPITAGLVKSLQLDRASTLVRFTADDAWALGCRLRAVAAERDAPVAIEIRRQGGSLVFATVLHGGTADNAGWTVRKIATALRFERCSLAVAIDLRARGLTLQDFGLTARHYAAGGGAVPLRVAGAGCIAAVAMSGLAGEEDHRLVSDAVTWLRNGQAT